MEKRILPITLENYLKDIPANATEPVLIRKLSDMVSLFKDGEEALKEGDRELYRFWTIEPAMNQPGEMAFGVTDLYPGTIGDEFNMTHGHYHAGAGAELYIGLKGADCCFSRAGKGAQDHRVQRRYRHLHPQRLGSPYGEHRGETMTFWLSGPQGLSMIMRSCTAMILKLRSQGRDWSGL